MPSTAQNRVRGKKCLSLSLFKESEMGVVVCYLCKERGYLLLFLQCDYIHPTLSKTWEDLKLLEWLSFLRFSHLGFTCSTKHTVDAKNYVTGRHLGDQEIQCTAMAE